jgi:hypothetical protein
LAKVRTNSFPIPLLVPLITTVCISIKIKKPRQYRGFHGILNI